MLRRTMPTNTGIGIYTIHQPNDSEGTAQSHCNTQLSFPRKRESSIDAGYLDSRWSLPSTRSGAGMTIYSRCIDTYALREKGLKPLSPREREGVREVIVRSSFQSFR